MSSSLLTSKGQTTIPKKIRELLNLHPGDEIDYVVDEDGKVFIEPVTSDITELEGFLHRPGMKPVSIKQMNMAMKKRFGASKK